MAVGRELVQYLLGPLLDQRPRKFLGGPFLSLVDCLRAVSEKRVLRGTGVSAIPDRKQEETCLVGPSIVRVLLGMGGSFGASTRSMRDIVEVRLLSTADSSFGSKF